LVLIRIAGRLRSVGCLHGRDLGMKTAREGQNEQKRQRSDCHLRPPILVFIRETVFLLRTVMTIHVSCREDDPFRILPSMEKIFLS